MLLDSLGNFPDPLTLVVQYALSEYFVKCRSVGVTLALGDLGNILMPSEMIGQAVNKILFTEQGLALDLVPDGFLADSLFRQLAVFFLCFTSRSGELSEFRARGRNQAWARACIPARRLPMLALATFIS